MFKTTQLSSLLEAAKDMNSNELQSLLEQHKVADSEDEFSLDQINELAMEDLNALNESANLDKDFFEKLQTIFQSSLKVAVHQQSAQLQESFDAQVKRELSARTEELEQLAEQYVQDEVVKKVNDYMDYLAEAWMKKNEAVVENNIRAELVENVIHGIRTVFEENSIDIPDDQIDHLKLQEQKIARLNESIDQTLADLSESQKANEKLQKQLFILEHTGNMTDVQRDKFNSLLDNVEAEDFETWQARATVLQEHVMTTTSKGKDLIMEDLVSQDTPPKSDENDPMQRYTKFLAGQ